MTPRRERRPAPIAHVHVRGGGVVAGRLVGRRPCQYCGEVIGFVELPVRPGSTRTTHIPVDLVVDEHGVYTTHFATCKQGREVAGLERVYRRPARVGEQLGLGLAGDADAGGSA